MAFTMRASRTTSLLSNMKNLKTKGIAAAVICVSFVLLAIPFISDAQQSYKPLAPLPNAAPPSGTNIATYLPGMFKLIIALTAVLAVVMLIIGGFQYITTDSISNRSEGKKRIQDAITGLILAIVSWLILYSINPNLTNFNLDLNYTARSVPTSAAPAGTGVGPQDVGGVEAGELDHAAGISAFGSTFTVSSTGSCSDRSVTTCTSLEGIKQTTVNGIVALKSACSSCSNLVVTGGTEMGHTAGQFSHYNGYKIDISRTQGDAAAFSSFLESKITTAGVPVADNTDYQTTINGTLYTLRRESDHWDITVLPYNAP